MNITSSYQVRIVNCSVNLIDTVRIYQEALSYLIGVVSENWDAVKSITTGALEQQRYIEKLVHGNKNREAKYQECAASEQPKVPEFESKTEKAAYLIKKLLSDGDMRAREIYMRMKDEGISRRTAENTKKELGIRSYRKMRQWYWSIHTGE